MKDLVLSDWYGIVVVSGDGLIFEVRFYNIIVSVSIAVQ